MTEPLDSIRADATATFGEAVAFNERLSGHTLYRIGGPADLFLAADSTAVLQRAVAFAREPDLPLVVIGHGSNLLVPDDGVRGLVVRVEIKTARVDGTALTAGAGLPLSHAARLAHEHALAGLEFSVGIPGTVGGAIVMNAGCHDAEIGALVEQVELVAADGSLRTVGPGECAFGYRTSALPSLGVAVVAATLRLAPGDPAEIERRMGEHRAWRAEAQPHGRPNAGSVFKNPPGDAAGRLIDAAGCKGLRVGDAEVSTVHANFIVNRDKATYADVTALIAAVRERVEAKFGVTLELELVDLGRTVSTSSEGAPH